MVLSTDPALEDDGDAARIFVTYGKLAESVGVGSKVLLDDGAIILEVKAISGGEVCRSASTRSPYARPHCRAHRSPARFTRTPRLTAAHAAPPAGALRRREHGRARRAQGRQPAGERGRPARHGAQG